jgi:hypothetical protein
MGALLPLFRLVGARCIAALWRVKSPPLHRGDRPKPAILFPLPERPQRSCPGASMLSGPSCSGPGHIGNLRSAGNTQRGAGRERGGIGSDRSTGLSNGDRFSGDNIANRFVVSVRKAASSRNPALALPFKVAVDGFKMPALAIR